MSRNYHSTTNRSCHHQSTTTINQYTSVSYTEESHRTECSEHSSAFGRNLTNRNGNTFGYCPNGDSTFGHNTIGDSTFGCCPIGNSNLGTGFGNNPYRDTTFGNNPFRDNVFGNNPYRDNFDNFGNNNHQGGTFGNSSNRGTCNTFGNNPTFDRNPGNNPIGGRPTHIGGRFSPNGIPRIASPISANPTPLETAISNSLNRPRNNVDTSPQNPVNGLRRRRRRRSELANILDRSDTPNGSKSTPSVPPIVRNPGNNPIRASPTHIERRSTPIDLVPSIVSPISTYPSFNIPRKNVDSRIQKPVNGRRYNATLHKRPSYLENIPGLPNIPNGSKSNPPVPTNNPYLSNDKSNESNTRKANQSALQSLIHSAKQRNQSRSKGKARECAVCMEDGKQPDCYLRDCGHLVTCMDCADKLQQCPVCRKHIKQRLRVYT